LGPDIFLRTVFLNTLSLCSSLNVRDQVSHPDRQTTGKIIVLYILNFIFDPHSARKERSLLEDIYIKYAQRKPLEELNPSLKDVCYNYYRLLILKLFNNAVLTAGIM
jgi:hypothetical protein